MPDVPRDLQTVVDDLAAVLRRSVVIDDIDKRLLAASAHWGDEDPVRVRAVLHRGSDATVRRALQPFHIDRLTGPSRIPGDEASGRKPRVAVPVRVDDTVVACLWLIDDGGLGDHDLQAAARAADRAAHVLATGLPLRSARVDRHHDTLVDLLGDDVHQHGPAAATLVAAGDLPAGAPVTVVVARGTPGLLSPVPGRVVARLGPEVVAVVPRATADLVAADLVADGGRAGVAADPVPLDDLRPAVAAARLAVRAAALGPPVGPVAHSDTLGAAGLLAALPDDALARAVPDSVLRLAAARSGADLCTTLQRWLEYAGDARRTAESLFVHRATLYDRLARIGEITGVDLHDGRSRLDVHLGLLARDLVTALAADDDCRPTPG